MDQVIYEMLQKDAIRVKEIEERALKGESISYDEYLATWGSGKLSSSWYENCGLFWSRKRLKSDILLKLTGIRRGASGTGAR